MNYQQIDAEKIKKVKEAEKKYAPKGAPNNNSYSSIGLKRLSNGTYKTAHQGAMAASKRRESRKHDPVYNPQVRSTVPSVQPQKTNVSQSNWRKGTNYTPNYVNKSKVEQDDRKFEQMLSGTSKPKPQGVKKPSTRYTNNKSTVDNLLNKELPKYDEKYKKDFEEFYLYRHDMSDAVDWDEATQEQIPTWQNLQKKMMKKYGWTEDEFNKKYGEYENYENARQVKGDLEVTKKAAEDIPVLPSLFSPILNIGSTIEGLDTAIRGLIPNGAVGTAVKAGLDTIQSASNPYNVDYDEWNHSDTRNKELIRQTVNDELNDPTKGTPLELALNAAGVNTGAIKSGAYNALMGLEDMAMNYTLGLGTPVGMGVVSGAQNARQNEQHALERGVDPDKAAKYGLATGTIAGLMNTVGLDSVMKSTAQTVAGQFLQGAAKEGLENVLEDLADTVVDQAMNNDKSEEAQMIMSYVESGMTPEEALNATLKDYLTQEAISFTSGAAFGGAMAAGKAAIPSLLMPETQAVEIPDTARIQAEKAQAEIERLREQIPEVPEEAPEVVGESAPVEVNPDDVIYHAGAVSRLNKAETRGMMHEGSRNSGYYGTGHYFVDNAHRGELDNNSNYNGKPYTSVDISQYGNLYKADTDAKAEKLHGFSEDYTRYANTYNDKYYTDADGHIDEEARAEYLDDLYKTFKELFPEQKTTKQQFIDQINAFRESEYDVDLHDMDDSVFTQLMKSMGYNGVDSTGTNYANTFAGTVIYDLDENSILQSNVTDAEAKKGLMNTRVRNEGQSVFDTAEDEKIQKSLDSVAKKRAISEEYHRLFDEPAYRQLKTELEETEQYLERSRKSLEEDTYTLNNPEAFAEAVEEHKRFQKQTGIDLGETEEESKNYVRDRLQEDIEDSKNLIAQREQRIKELKANVSEMEKASKAAYEQAKAKVNGIPEEDLNNAVANSVAEDLNNTNAPKKVSDQIAEAIQKDNFTPITFTDTDGYTHILTRSTRDGEKWQVSHLDETGRAVGHNAYANDADLLNKLKTDDKVGNLVEINTDNNILTQPEVTINDMVKNSGLFSKKDFEKALRTIDRNADTYGASKGDLIEAIMFNINEESSTGDLPVKVSSNTYESFRNKIGAESNPASPDSNAGEIKLVRNKETGEYTYGDYRIVKEGKSKYNILDADGNTVGNARTLNDVKAELQRLQNGAEVETPETETPAEPQNTPKATTQKAPSNYDIDSMEMDDGSEKFFVVETKPDGTEDFADGKFYDTEEEAQAALEAMSKPAETPEPTNEVPNVKKPTKKKSKPVPEVVETPKAETPKAEVPNVKPAEEDVEIPPEGPGEKVRSFSKRASNDEELPEEIRNIMGEDFYSVVRNADTKAKADELFDADNLTQTRSNFDQAVDRLDPAASLLGYKLAKAYVDNGDYDAAVDVLHKVSENLTRGGQFTQAAKLAMLQNDPMAAARSYMRDLDSLNEWGRKKYKKKWNKIELSKEDLEGFNKIQKGDKEALSTYIDTLNAKYGKMIPANWWDKLVAGTKISMLLNPRTQVRNIGSNAALVPIRSMSDRVSALGQNAVHIFNKDFEVTQSLVGGTKEQKQIAGQIFDSMKDEILGENKMKDSVKSDILSHRQIFNDDYLARWIDEKTNGGLQRLNEYFGSDGNQSTAETLQNLTYWLMGDFGDTPFVKKNFVNRLASYMKAQGITNIDDVPDDAINIAIEEALKATFKDDNAFTQALQGIKGKSGKLGEVALPFVKTPANLAMRAVDYSPFGVINTIRKAKSGADLSRVIDDLSKNLTGSAMIMLGYALRNAGIITGSYSEDKNEAAFQKQQGMLENAFKIGGKYFNYDWMQPGGTPLLLGSTLYDAIKLSDKENAKFSDYLNAGWNGMLNVGNAILESSPLQTAADLLGGSQYDKGGIAGNVANEVLEFPQRLIPSVLGATARTVDPTYRDTYVSDSSLTGMLGNLVRSSAAKIPFLSKLLPASYNSWGFERKRSDNAALGAASQYILPGAMGNDQTTGLDEEVQRLYDSTGMSEVFPHKAPNNLKLGSQYVTLTPQQHSDYQREMGQQSFEYAKNLMGNAQFEKLTDEQKVDALNSAYSLAEKLAKEKVFDYHAEKVDTIEKIAKTRGAAGVTDYLIASQKAKELDMGVNDYLKYEQEWKGGAEQYKKDKDAGEKLDLSPTEYADAEKNYQGGAVQYSKDKKTAESLGMSMSDFIKKNEDYDGGATQYAEDKQKARELGFVNSDNSVNVDQYNKAVEVVGDDRNKLYDYQSFKSQGYTKRSEMVPVLEGMNNFTDDEKGRILAKNVSSISNAAQGMQDQFGDKGLYYYYLIFDKADANHNNNLSKKEKEAFFNNKSNYSNLQFLSQDMINYLMANMK